MTFAPFNRFAVASNARSEPKEQRHDTENSPWVAEQAWEKRPFASLDDMHAAMVAVAKYAPAAMRRALLQSHPDLAGREAQTGTMTASSVAEQASAGLNALSPDEMARISELNAAYRKKFGFPFIIAVRMHTKEGILWTRVEPH